MPRLTRTLLRRAGRAWEWMILAEDDSLLARGRCRLWMDAHAAVRDARKVLRKKVLAPQDFP